MSLSDRIVLVAGATGNMGPFVVRALLEQQASVVVAPRSEERLAGLREHLGRHVEPTALDALTGVRRRPRRRGQGRGASRADRREGGAAPGRAGRAGRVHHDPLAAGRAQGDIGPGAGRLRRRAFRSRRTFLPAVRDAGGTYILLQGPLAFELHPEFEGHLISIATAAQHMLFRALAQDSTTARRVWSS